eukprot:4245924-Amphidinium_carterae.1
MGTPIGVWTIDEWHRIDNNASMSIWLDHSISTWSVTETQWHMNEYSAITMLNTPSLRRSFRQFCDHNGLSAMLLKYMDNDGNMRPQFVRTMASSTTTSAQLMALHKWNGPEPTMVNGQHVTMRVGTPPNNGPDMTI